MSVYDFEVKDGDGNMVSLSEFKDKVLLINQMRIHTTIHRTERNLQRIQRRRF